jgi:cobalt-zinc-cadmium efflux system outer membrane protein
VKAKPVAVAPRAKAFNSRTPGPFRILGVVTLLLPALARGQITEDEAVHRALARPEVQDVLEGEVEVARGDALRAGMWPNPIAAYSREQTYGGPVASYDNYVLLSQSVDVSGRRALRGDAGERRVEAARDRGRMTRLGIEAVVRITFHDVVAGEARVAALRDSLRRVERLAAATAQREKAGDASGYDRMRLERERESVAARLAAQEGHLERARARLEGLLGARSPVQVSGTLLPPDSVAPSDAIVGLVALRPDLKALGEDAVAADLDARASGRWWIPDLTLTAGYKGTGVVGEQVNGYVAGIAIPLPFFDRAQDEAARSEGRARQARGRLRLEADLATADVRGLSLEAARLADAARRFRGDATSTSARLLVTAEAAYRGGELGVLELVDAQRSALDADLQAIDLESAARRARIELVLASGGASR